MPYRRKFNAYEKRVVAARQGWRCAGCGALLEAAFEVDHEVALFLGGEDAIENMHAKCVPCHREKTVREEIDRLRAREAAARARRPPLVCTRCGRVVSPYFAHAC